MTATTTRTLALIALVWNSPLRADDVQPPFHPDEAKIFRDIIAREKHDVEVAEMPGWAKGGVVKALEGFGVSTKGVKTWGVVVKDKKGLFFHAVYGPDGRVLGFSGNGAWLQNDSLRALKGMPEVRVIRIDHNGTFDKATKDLYDGRGFDALTDSKLLDIKLTLGLDDKGMAEAAKIKGLRTMMAFHARTTDAGVRSFEGHPSLTSFSVGEMGVGVTEKALASIARMPHLTHVGFHEVVVGYDTGFSLLAPLKGQLKEIDLSMSVTNAADLAKLKADHPQAKVTILSAPEIVKRHIYVAQRLAEKATGEAAVELKAAIAAAKK